MNRVYIVVHKVADGFYVIAFASHQAAHQFALEIVRERREDFGVHADISDEEALVEWSDHTNNQECIEETVCDINH